MVGSFSCRHVPTADRDVFIGSVQLLFIGVVGEYVGNILRKVTPNNPQIVKELINFENADDDPYLMKSVTDDSND